MVFQPPVFIEVFGILWKEDSPGPLPTLQLAGRRKNEGYGAT